MKKFSVALITLALTVLPLLAQDHQHAKEKKVSDEITISSPVLISGQTLAAGRYRIECDHQELVFVRTADGKKIAFPCKGTEMAKKSDSTELYTSVNKDGVRVANRLLLKGSPVDHTL